MPFIFEPSLCIQVSGVWGRQVAKPELVVPQAGEMGITLDLGTSPVLDI